MTFEIPEELRESKETWFKVFTTKSLISTLVFATIGYVVKLFFDICGASLFGWVVFGLFALTGFLLFTIRLPGSATLGGGRLYLAQKLWRWFLHRKNKAVYLPVYGTTEEEEYEEPSSDDDGNDERDDVPILT